MYNPEKHHRRSVRLKNHGYNDGFYFVTICCENRVCVFGKIKDAAMILNDCGKIALEELSKTAELRSDVNLYGFVVMPNHVHAILEINDVVPITVGARRALPRINVLPRNCILPSASVLPLPNRFQNMGKNTLPSIVGAYKSAVSKRIHETGFIGNVWQRNYHERVIRSAISYQRASKYIFDNPANWKDDVFFVPE